MMPTQLEQQSTYNDGYLAAKAGRKQPRVKVPYILLCIWEAGHAAGIEEMARKASGLRKPMAMKAQS